MPEAIETFKSAVFIPLTSEEVGDQKPKDAAKARLLEYLKEIGVLTNDFKELPDWVRCVPAMSKDGITVIGVWNQPVRVLPGWLDDSTELRNVLRQIARIANQAAE